MNKRPLASAVMAAANKVTEHHVQRLGESLQRARNAAREAQIANRQVVGVANEILTNADRKR